MTIPRQGTLEWQRWRKGGIGASELPAIVGADPWKGEYELAVEKRSDADPEPPNDAMAWGHRVQRAALLLYAEQHDVKVRESHTSVVSKRYPHVYASLDGRIVGQRKGVEVKLARDRWDDEPPRRVIIQAQAQMGVVGLDVVHVVKVQLGYSAPLVFTIERDDALIADLLPLGEEWYVRYVLGDELPPLDGSAAARRALNGQHGAPEMRADIEQAALAARLQGVRERARCLEAEEADLVLALKKSMAGAYRLVGDGFTVSWRPSKPSEKTDWKSVAEGYRAALHNTQDARIDGGWWTDEALDAIEGIHTTTSDGARPFRVTYEGAGT